MIQLRSNARSLAARIGKFQRKLPVAMTTGIRALGESAFIRIATRVLARVSDEETKLYVPVILRTFSVDVHEFGQKYKIGSPKIGESGAVGNVMGAVRIMEYLTGRRYPDGSLGTRRPENRLAPSEAQEAAVDLVRQGILEWVTAEKRKSPEEADESDEAIADRMMELIGVHSELVPSTRTQAMKDAGERLARRVQDFMVADKSWLPGERPGIANQPVSAALMTSWLVAILKQWRLHILQTLPGNVRKEIRKAWRQTLKT